MVGTATPLLAGDGIYPKFLSVEFRRNIDVPHLFLNRGTGLGGLISYPLNTSSGACHK